MIEGEKNGADEPATPQPPGPRRVRRTLLVADLVESVRLMLADEAGTIARWQDFVRAVRDDVLPALGGRLVKSLGDGFLLEFLDVHHAMSAALRIVDLLALAEATAPAASALHLRIGVHAASVVIDEIDVLEAGVNLAARLATLAGPGDIVVSVAVRDQCLPGLDPELEDLGECFLKHIDDSVRAFRVRRDPAQRLESRQDEDGAALPTLLVRSVPLAGATADPLAQAIADSICAALSSCRLVRVLSRLTTLFLAHRAVHAGGPGENVPCDYVLAGARESSDATVISWRLLENRTGAVLWEQAQRHERTPSGALDATLAGDIAWGAIQALTGRQLQLALALPLSNLPSYSLLLSAVMRLHGMSGEDFAASRAALDHLVERHPRSADARTWLAKWHFLQLAQARSSAPAEDLGRARQHLARTLDQAPDHALGAALDAHLDTFAARDPARARARLDDVVAAHPNESLAWLFLSDALAALGEGAPAVDAILHAQSLSPLDPLRYYFDLFAAHALSVAGRFEDSLGFARRSVRGNALHLPSLAQLIVSLACAGQRDEARRFAARYLALRPDASVQRFIDHHVCVDAAIVRRDADALLDAGLPL